VTLTSVMPLSTLRVKSTSSPFLIASSTSMLVLCSNRTSACTFACSSSFSRLNNQTCQPSSSQQIAPATPNTANRNSQTPASLPFVADQTPKQITKHTKSTSPPRTSRQLEWCICSSWE